MNWFFDDNDPFAVSIRDFCKSLPNDIPDDAKLSRNSDPWNKGKRGLQQAWNKGKKMNKKSPETIEKLSNSLSGRTLSEEHKQKIGKANSISKLGSIPWNKGKRIK